MQTPSLTAAAAPLSPLAHALARLADSRARLHHELVPAPKPQAAGSGAGLWPGPWPPQLKALWRRGGRLLRRLLGQSPTAAALLGGLAGAAQDTWRRHPWRPTAELLGREAGAAVLPAVRRHPLAAVAVAAGLGMAIVAGRAWHWPILSRRLRDSPQRLGRWLLHQLAQPALQTALLSVLVMAVQRKTADDVPAAAADLQAAAPEAPPQQAV